MSKTTDQAAVSATILSCSHIRHVDAAEKMIVSFQIKWELDDYSDELNSLHLQLNNHKQTLPE
jgi:hypothetical protein